ncbi:hypothetical protein [Siphonobacter sp. SORGH_AS_0500]|nr:hypothetical protein [Siphonobacter sp. SORGH_AS_0500]MDR6197876.1 hypothetical protein [Siphonobacter sp. SORGH_AS_0500]
MIATPLILILSNGMEAAAVLAKAGKSKSKKRYQNLSDTAR